MIRILVVSVVLGLILCINKTLSVIPFLQSEIRKSNADLTIEPEEPLADSINATKLNEILKIFGDNNSQFSPRVSWWYWIGRAFLFSGYDSDKEDELGIFSYWNYSKLLPGEAYISEYLANLYNVWFYYYGYYF
jgi:hypothetical protein